MIYNFNQFLDIKLLLEPKSLIIKKKKKKSLIIQHGFIEPGRNMRK